MGFEICYEKAKHHQNTCEYFDFNKLDAFHNEDILSVIYGNEWYSILITENDKALLHAFSKLRIGETEWYDIEPFLGYSGPITNTNDERFIAEALKLYSNLCKEENVIAEVMRFNCILRNYIFFKAVPFLQISPAKQIVIVDCLKNDQEQLKQFSEPCRRRVKKGIRNCKFKVFNETKQWEQFSNFYSNSLKRTGADKKWFLPSSFFERARYSSYFNVYSVLHEGELVSASLVVEHPLAAYYLLAGNSDKLVPGASESLIFYITRSLTNKDIPFLILGGGNSPAEDDSLLRFKRKFARTTQTFFIGKMIHIPEIFQKLCNKAIRINPGIKNTEFFLKYRLVKYFH